MVLLGPTHLFIFGKSSQEHCFLHNKYKKIPTYTVIRAPRLLGTPEQLLCFVLH